MRRTAGPTATILDVARLAGVSRTTVSRVLNEPERVLPETVTRVRDAATELGYSPSSVARGLRSGRTGLLALLVGDISQPFHGTLSRTVAAEAEALGAGVMLYDLGHSQSRLAEVMRKLPGQGVEGVLLATADEVSDPAVVAAVTDCLDRGISIVSGVARPEVAGMVSVVSDHPAATRIAVEALATDGFHTPALVLGSSTGPIARLLAQGAPEAVVIEAGYTFDATMAAVSLLDDAVDSLIVANLPMALGARAALARTGRELPMVVCEEVALASQLTPSFTTSAVAPESLGAEMVRLIDGEIRGTPAAPEELLPALIRRDSF